MVAKIYPSIQNIKDAHQRIKPFIHKTPVLKSTLINELLNVDFYFKCENFQKVGAFKFRGATNAVQLLSNEEASMGVTTHSSGNHAAALSLAARQRGIPAYIVMPENAPEIKKIAVKSYGAEITFCEPTLEARERTLEMVQQKTGATFIHPYNNFNVIAGQGTAAVELLEEAPFLDIVIAPVGGGGLLSGTAIATKAIKPNAKVYAAEPLNADDAYRSFKQGVIIPSVKPITIADGLLTSLGTITFEAIRNNVDDIFTAKKKQLYRPCDWFGNV
jgi:threonine dehydratase